MWHEARKQERLLKTMMVDHRRRAERRREYYEKTKGDPAQFLQVHGRPMKIHVDPAVADSPATMMPWQGQTEILIDRFDVRAHLDVIPCHPSKNDCDTYQYPGEEGWEERQASYERYRILVQNEFIGVSEEKFLHQILLEEQFGPVQKFGEEEKKKMLAPKKAAIGFTYDDSVPSSSTAASISHNIPLIPPEATEEEESDSDIDLDLSIDVNKLTTEQMHEVNKCALHYGLGRQDFMSLLTRDLDEQESLRIAKEEEQERAMYSGRKARKERRAFREQKLQALLTNRCLSPPSYATRASPTYDGKLLRSKSVSKSRSPSPFEGGIKFITSFGDEDSDPGKKLSSRSPNKTRDKDLSNKRLFVSTTFLAQDRGGRSFNSGSNTTKVHEKRNSRSGNSRATSSSLISRSIKDQKPGSSYFKKGRSRSRKRSRHHRSRSRSRSRRRSRHSRSRSRSYSPITTRRQRNRSLSRGRNRRISSSSSSNSSSSRSVSSHPTIRRSSSPIRSPPSSTSITREIRHYSPPQLPNNPLPNPPVRRYYGRQMNDSDLSLSDAESTSPLKPSASCLTSKPSTSLVTGSSRGPGATKSTTFSPQERLKRKMQAALNKQYKADKRAEKEKLQKAEQERMNREEEMRELALRLRRKERIRRHAARGESGNSSPSTRSQSSSPSRTPS